MSCTFFNEYFAEIHRAFLIEKYFSWFFFHKVDYSGKTILEFISVYHWQMFDLIDYSNESFIRHRMNFFHIDSLMNDISNESVEIGGFQILLEDNP